ncbi:hypothetical protein [Saccharopolyspora sp. 5N102]|uniref:hypothetical protein n=1 Tax=Saccharopolyspora sp. 5N102 TaxID=3375155 RepID=UPI0037C5D35C
MVTPEPEQPDDSEFESTGGRGPGVHNLASGVASGVVQAGVVHGDVHLHAAPPTPALVVPRQLPAAPGLFTGRAADLAEFKALLPDPVQSGVQLAVHGRRLGGRSVLLG